MFDFSVHRFDSGLLFFRFITWVFRLTILIFDFSVHRFDSVNITKSQVENPLLYKITLFASTGPIQAQGKEYDKFVSKVFPLLLKSVDFICGDPELQPKDSQSENPSNVEDSLPDF
jgi:hypothetical protein